MNLKFILYPCLYLHTAIKKNLNILHKTNFSISFYDKETGKAFPSHLAVDFLLQAVFNIILDRKKTESESKDFGKYDRTLNAEA